MKLKSYFSGTVEAAMELASKELGEDALLVNARPSTPETRYLGAYEVVFGLQNGSAPENGHPAPAGDRQLAQEIAGMKRELEKMMQSFSARLPAFAAPAVADPSPALAPLLRQELDASLAAKVANGTPFEDLFEVDATLGTPGAACAMVVLVGPPGAGKTTTLAKLAARYGLASRKPAQILSADVCRIGAADQLRTLAGILGIGCEVAETAGALAQMIAEHRSREFIFIDTPGLARAEMEDAADLARLIAELPGADTHLVLPAFMRRADMDRVIGEYSIFQPKKLLFTRIDETAQYGALVSEAARCSLPISFLGTGQQIPDDLEPATKARFSELILGAPSNGARTRGAVA
jgi:flagellar biosynthesis protein FlhF